MITETFVEIPSKKYKTITVTSEADIPKDLDSGFFKIKFDSSIIKESVLQDKLKEHTNLTLQDTIDLSGIKRTQNEFYIFEDPKLLIDKYIAETGKYSEYQERLKILVSKMELQAS